MAFNREVSQEALSRAYNKCVEQYKEYQRHFRVALSTFLKENGLDGLVRNKITGKLGYLDVMDETDLISRLTSGVATYRFFPLKKDGTKSKKWEYFFCSTSVDSLLSTWRDLLREFEPVEESEDT